MPEIQIVPAGVTVAPCPSCGKPAGLASGMALRDGNAWTIDERDSALPVDPAGEEARTERPDGGQSSNSA